MLSIQTLGNLPVFPSIKGSFKDFNQSMVNECNKYTNGLFLELDKVEKRLFDIHRVTIRRGYIQVNRNNLALFAHQMGLIVEYEQSVHINHTSDVGIPLADIDKTLDKLYPVEEYIKICKTGIRGNIANDVPLRGVYLDLDKYQWREVFTEMKPIEFKLTIDSALQMIVNIQDRMRELYVYHTRSATMKEYLDNYISFVRRLLNEVLVPLFRVFHQYVIDGD